MLPRVHRKRIDLTVLSSGPGLLAGTPAVHVNRLAPGDEVRLTGSPEAGAVCSTTGLPSGSPTSAKNATSRQRPLIEPYPGTRATNRFGEQRRLGPDGPSHFATWVPMLVACAEFGLLTADDDIITRWAAGALASPVATPEMRRADPRFPNMIHRCVHNMPIARHTLIVDSNVNEPLARPSVSRVRMCAWEHIRPGSP